MKKIIVLATILGLGLGVAVSYASAREAESGGNHGIVSQGFSIRNNSFDDNPSSNDILEAQGIDISGRNNSFSSSNNSSNSFNSFDDNPSFNDISGRNFSGGNNFFDEDFGRGRRGDDVLELQRDLQILGMFNVAPTGFFGPVTQQAVQNFQRQFGIPATGFVGPLTRNALNGIISNSGRGSINSGPGSISNFNQVNLQGQNNINDAEKEVLRQQVIILQQQIEALTRSIN